MVYYYLGYFALKLRHAADAVRYDQLAMQMPPDYVFPFQNEAIGVLRSAIEANPHDARATYYLGNLLYDWQPEEATRMWEASAALDPTFAITHRNLATAYMHRQSGPNIDKAIAELEKAVSLDHKFALHFTELDELYEQAGTPLEKRLMLFKQNEPVVARRDDALNREIALEIGTGKLDDAIATMSAHTFAVAEGENLNVVEHWTEAHILRAEKEIEARHNAEALNDLQAAGGIPSNLPIGIGIGGANPRAAEIAYWSGVAYAGSGRTQQAEEAWKQAVARSDGASARRNNRPENSALASDQPYYQALAFQKLGQEEKAQELFRNLVQSGKDVLRGPAGSGGNGRRTVSPRTREANAHYIAGLGYLGLKDGVAAKAELRQAATISPDLVDANLALARLQ
jgi:tetratricopeptide (TPR) repeat protein